MLSELQASATDAQLRRAVIRAFANLIELARTEKDPKLRREIILTLGRHRSQKNAEALVSLYASENGLNLRKAVIEALGDQNNAKALVEIARTETDLRLKKLLVERLSHMRSKEASDYLLEVLNK